MFPAPSRDVQVTVVVPSGNRLPDACVQLTVTPGALSLAVGGANGTAALAFPGSLPTVLLGGAVTVGGCVSITRIVKPTLAGGVVLELQVTSVVPSG